MRRGLDQPLALAQRLGDELEVVIFEVAQAAMDQFGRRGGGVRGEIVALDQQYLEAVERGLARDGAAVDAAADDEYVISHGRRVADARVAVIFDRVSLAADPSRNRLTAPESGYIGAAARRDISFGQA